VIATKSAVRTTESTAVTGEVTKLLPSPVARSLPQADEMPKFLSLKTPGALCGRFHGHATLKHI
jgi:hypothetical protein